MSKTSSHAHLKAVSLGQPAKFCVSLSHLRGASIDRNPDTDLVEILELVSWSCGNTKG